MINNQVEFYPFYRGNKLKVIVKLDLLDAMEQIFEQVDFQDEIEEIEIITSVNSEIEENENIGASSSVNFSLLKFNTLIEIINQRKKEKIKEKERKEIYKEKKDREKQQEKQKVCGNKSDEIIDENDNSVDVTDQVFVKHSQAQQVNAKHKKYFEPKPDELINKWTSEDFLKYMQNKYKDTYGYNSMEFTVFGGKKYAKSASGVIRTVIKRQLIDVFVNSNMVRQDLKNYIDWMYEKKSGELKFPVTLNFICNKGMMTEWTHDLKYSSKGKNNKNFQFSKKVHSNIKK